MNKIGIILSKNKTRNHIMYFGEVNIIKNKYRKIIDKINCKKLCLNIDYVELNNIGSTQMLLENNNFKGVILLYHPHLKRMFGY